MADSPVQVITSADEFKALISANTYVVVDFWAEWCPPCKAISPMFTKAAAQHAVASHLAFAKVDADAVPDVCQEYSITSLPSFLLFEDGKADGLDLAATAKGPMVKTTDAGKVKMIQGADPKSLLAIIAELGKRAKEKKDSELSFGGEDF